MTPTPNRGRLAPDAPLGGDPSVGELGAGRLDRPTILLAALRIIDEEGLGRMTMRRLATELGVEAMSIYHHFENKDSILSGVVAVVFATLDVPAVGRDPLAALGQLGRSYRSILHQHPNVVPLIAMHSSLTRPEPLGVQEFVSGLTNKLGLTTEEGALALATVLTFVLGQVIAELGGDEPAVGAADQDSTGTFDDETFEFGLAALLTGLAQSKKHPGGRRRTPRRPR
jgi:TetR/AcrR family tetracycline transcriptional repressor